VRQETGFPEASTTRLVLGCREAVELTLRLRHPGWAQGPLAVTVNGEEAAVESEPGTYAELSRTFHDGDTVEVTLPMGLHVETLPDTPDVVAVLYGPIVLAGELGQEDMKSPYERDQLDQARFPHPVAPAFVTDASDGSWLSQIERVSNQELLFRTRGLVRPHDVDLMPFHRVHHERQAVYWRVMTKTAWDERTAAAEATQAELEAIEAIAVDHVLPGDQVSEGAHGFAGEKTQSGALSGRGWRIAQYGGFFSYELGTGGQDALELVVAYGSRDVARRFEVQVDGVKIAAPDLDGTAPGEYFLARYPLPKDLLQGKPTVTVRFKAREGWNTATANVFGCVLRGSGLDF
jgi:hypothetical protein